MLVVWVVAVLSIAVFLAAFARLGIVRVSGEALRVSRAAAAAMRDPALDDRARERAVQRASVRLLGQFVSLLLRGGVAVAASFAPIAIAALLGFTTSDAVIAFLSRWPAWVLASAMAAAAWTAGGRRWPTN